MAAVLQRKCWVKWGRLTFYPNLYIVLIGPPAARKGTAMEEGRNLLDRMGVSIAADAGSWQKLVSNMAENQTTDQGADGKVYLHSSITIFSTELTIFLGYDNKEMLSVLCDWFDCRSRFVYDTFRGDREEIPNVWANLLGATTPSQYQASLPEEAFGSGFASRVVHIYEDGPGKVVYKPEITPALVALQDSLLSDLEDAKAIHGEFITTPEFETIYIDWRKASIKTTLFPDEPRLEHYVQRRQVFVFKLAMICSASRNSDQVIEGEDIQRAIDSLEEVEKKMPQTFRGVGSNPLASQQNRMMKVLKEVKNIRSGDLYSLFSNDLTHTQFREVLGSLCVIGFCEQDVADKSSKGAMVKLR